jgi:pimeloyl-ACP methyl ester carboxylesterase
MRSSAATRVWMASVKRWSAPAARAVHDPLLMKTIVWVHGFPLSSQMFEAQRAIPGATHLTPDLPGFGSTPPEDDLSVDDYARFVVDLLPADQAVFAGFSMGGYICLAVARLFPERVNGLVLIDTKETADTEEVRKGRFDSIAKVEQQGIDPIVDSMFPKMLTASAPQALKDRVRGMMMTSSPQGVIAALRAMAGRADSSSLLPSIPVPTLVIVGDQDSITPVADARRMAGAIPNARLVTIADAAHLAPVEQPAAVNAAVAQFLA